MHAADVIDLHTYLNDLGIEVWLDGGWGVGALQGDQTRSHSYVDIVIQHKDVCHTGCKPRESDLKNISSLYEHFGIDYSKEYTF